MRNQKQNREWWRVCVRERNENERRWKARMTEKKRMLKEKMQRKGEKKNRREKNTKERENGTSRNRRGHSEGDKGDNDTMMMNEQQEQHRNNHEIGRGHCSIVCFHISLSSSISPSHPPRSQKLLAELLFRPSCPGCGQRSCSHRLRASYRHIRMRERKRSKN